jgi:hypothetical protein
VSQESAKKGLKEIANEVRGWPVYMRTSSSASKVARSSSASALAKKKKI